MPATLFFLTETADWWTVTLSGHLVWLDEGSLFSLDYDFYSWICLHSWNSLDCDLPEPAAVSGARPSPRSPGCWLRAPSELHCPLAPDDRHSAQVGLFTNIDHWAVPQPSQAGSQDPAITHWWTLSTTQCVCSSWQSSLATKTDRFGDHQYQHVYRNYT